METHQVVETVTLVVSVASLLANVLPPTVPVLGPLVHWLALNGSGIQSAVRTVRAARR